MTFTVGRAWARIWYWGGVIGFIAAGLTIIVGGQLLTGLGQSTSRTLTLLATTLETTVDSTTTVLDTLALAEEGMTQTEAALDSAGTGLTEMSAVMSETSALLGTEIPNTLDAITGSFPAMIDTARVIDRTMRALAVLGVDYEPAVPLDESLEEISAQMVPLSANLRAQSAPLATAATEIEAVGGDVDLVATSVRSITEQLTGSQELVVEYRQAATEASTLVTEVAANFDRQIALARILLIALSVAVLVAMSVPVVLGRQALRALPPT